MAEKLHMVRSEMLERMSADEFYDWMAVALIDDEQKPEIPTSAKKPKGNQQTEGEMLAALIKAGGSIKRGRP